MCLTLRQNEGAKHGRNRYIKGSCRSKQATELDPKLMQKLFDAQLEFTANPIYAHTAVIVDFLPLGKVRAI